MPTQAWAWHPTFRNDLERFERPPVEHLSDCLGVHSFTSRSGGNSCQAELSASRASGIGTCLCRSDTGWKPVLQIIPSNPPTRYYQCPPVRGVPEMPPGAIAMASATIAYDNVGIGGGWWRATLRRGRTLRRDRKVFGHDGAWPSTHPSPATTERGPPTMERGPSNPPTTIFPRNRA